MKFLITNDDGVNAPGLLALYEALSEIGEVIVVAPSTEQSGSASSLHITQPLYLQTLPSGFIAVNGSPADCIYLALHELFCETTFDCVITGINSGANLGQDVLFSGTFGAASTAQLFGIPAIASSLTTNIISNNSRHQTPNYTQAGAEIVKLITQTSIIQEMQNLPYHVLNVNIPNVKHKDEIKGRRVTSLSHSQIDRPVHRITDPRGHNAYWLSLRKRPHSEASPTKICADDIDATTDNNSAHPTKVILTDNEAVMAGFVSLSPVKVQHTPPSALDKLARLNS